MSYTLTVPRVLGGTLLITFTPSTAPTTTVTAYGRDGKTTAHGRDGIAQARGRDGMVQGKGH